MRSPIVLTLGLLFVFAGACSVEHATDTKRPMPTSLQSDEPTSPPPEPPTQSVVTNNSPVTVEALPTEADSRERLLRLRTTTGGESRTWLIAQQQESEPPGGPRPFLIVLHGVGGNGPAMRTLGFEELAGSTVIAYPDAVDGSWNDERTGVDSRAHREHVDDVRFIGQIVEDAKTRFGIDPLRVFIVGVSNGGIMAAYIGCSSSVVIRAIALVNAMAPANLPQTCRAQPPIATLIVHGSQDKTVPAAGGPVAANAGRARGSVMSLTDYFALLLARSGCSGKDVTTTARVQRWSGRECVHGPEPVANVVFDGAHSWFVPPMFPTTATVWFFLTAQ
ncbi:MAG: alpha/beta hydrolase family esterase [Acidimicrobiia bacterium]